MIDTNTINKIPYVTSDPDIEDGQSQMIFILDGDSIDGADSETGTEGDLNKPLVLIQDNVEVLSENGIAQQQTIDQLVSEVNTLTGQDGADLGVRLSTLESNVASRTQQIVLNTNHIGLPSTNETPATGMYQLIENVQSDIGTRDPNDIISPSANDNSIRSDLWFIKSVLIGNKLQYDPNGTYNPDYTTATGITGELQAFGIRMNSAESSLSDITTRLTTLEDTTVQGSVVEIRADLGGRTDAGYIENETVFGRLLDLETQQQTNTQSIDDINNTLTDPDGISATLQSIQSDLNSVTQLAGQNQSDISTVSQTVDTNTSSISTNGDSISNLVTIVGSTNWQSETTSLQYRVNLVESVVGTQSDSNDDSTLYGYINTLLLGNTTGSLNNAVSRINTLESSTENFSPRITYIENLIGSDTTAGSGFTLEDSGAILLDNTTPINIITATVADGITIGETNVDVKLVGNVSINTETPVTLSGATFTGEVQGIDPVNPQDFTTLNYIESNFVNITGGEFTGEVQGINPTTSTAFTTKQYVDDIDTNIRNDFVESTGGTFTGAVTAPSFNVGTNSYSSNSNGALITATDTETGDNYTLEVSKLNGVLYSDAGTEYKVYHEGNRPTPSDINATEQSPDDNTKYIRQNRTWAALPIQDDAPADNAMYGRVNNTWQELNINNIGKLHIINELNDFNVIDGEEVITLEDGVNYMINGEIDIGGHRFVVSTGYVCSIFGESSYISKIISNTTGALFTSSVASLTMHDIGLTTSDTGSIFNLSSTSDLNDLSFVHLYNVDIDRTGSLGTINGLNEFLWNGSNFATFLMSSDPSLKVIGDTDIVRIDGFIPSYWTGALFDLDNTQGSIRVVDFSNMDIKIQSTDQMVFSANTTDDSIQNAGVGTISDIILRQHPNPNVTALTTQQFRTFIRSNAAFGGLDSASVNWHISNGINVCESETYAVITQSEDTTITVTDTTQTIFGSAGVLSNENANTSRIAYNDGKLIYSTHDYDTMILRLDWNLYSTESESFSIKFNVIVTDEYGSVNTYQRTRKIIPNTSTTTNIRLPIRIGTNDNIHVEYQIDSGNSTSYTVLSSDCTLTLE